MYLHDWTKKTNRPRTYLLAFHLNLNIRLKYNNKINLLQDFELTEKFRFLGSIWWLMRLLCTGDRKMRNKERLKYSHKALHANTYRVQREIDRQTNTYSTCPLSKRIFKLLEINLPCFQASEKHFCLIYCSMQTFCQGQCLEPNALGICIVFFLIYTSFANVYSSIVAFNA